MAVRPGMQSRAHGDVEGEGGDPAQRGAERDVAGFEADHAEGVVADAEGHHVEQPDGHDDKQPVAAEFSAEFVKLGDLGFDRGAKPVGGDPLRDRQRGGGADGGADGAEGDAVKEPETETGDDLQPPDGQQQDREDGINEQEADEDLPGMSRDDVSDGGGVAELGAGFGEEEEVSQGQGHDPHGDREDEADAPGRVWHGGV